MEAMEELHKSERGEGKQNWAVGKYKKVILSQERFQNKGKSSNEDY